MSNIGFIKSDNNHNADLSPIVPEGFTHAVAIGETGSGKTSTFIYPNLKDRIAKGHAILVYDYKGKEHLVLKHLAKEANRLNDVVEINKPWGANINILKFMTFAQIGDFLRKAQGDMQNDTYWSNFTANIALATLKVTAAYAEFEQIGKSINPKLYNSIFDSKIYEDAGFYGKSMRSIYETSSELNRLKYFVTTCLFLDEKVKKFVFEVYKRAKGESKDISRLIISAKRLEESNAQSQKVLERFKDIDETDSSDHISKMALNYMQCTMAYADIGSNKMLNTDEYDIPNLLEQGKIIVFNVHLKKNYCFSCFQRSL